MSKTFFKNTVTQKVGPTVYIPAAGYEDKVYKLLQPAVRFRRSDVIELKGVTHHTVSTVLSKDQKTFIETLKRDLVVQYKTGQVTAVNAPVLVGKLLQGYAGAVYTSEKEVIDLSPRDRIETAKTLIDAAEGKVLMFASFRHVCKQVHSKLIADKFRSGNEMALITGETDDDYRYRVFTRFQDPRDPMRLIIAHPKCMSHGLNLTQANTVIWYIPTTSAETYQQANGRITRAGQEREQLIYHLRAGANEDKVYRTLAARGSMQACILDLFEHLDEAA